LSKAENVYKLFTLARLSSSVSKLCSAGEYFEMNKNESVVSSVVWWDYNNGV